MKKIKSLNPNLLRNCRPVAKDLLALLTAGFSLVACGPGFKVASNQLADKTSATVGCTSFEDDFWDNLYTVSLSKQAFPTSNDMRIALSRSLNQDRLKALSEEQRRQLRETLTQLYQTVAIDSLQVLNAGAPATPERALTILTALELGDRSTPERDQLQNQIRALFTQVQNLAGSSRDTCPVATVTPVDSSPVNGNTMLNRWKATRPALVYGGLKSLVTAYQSCDVGALKPIDASVGDVKGISVIGTYSDGIGLIRKISDLTTLNDTDYYLEHHRAPMPTCFAVEKNPLIYNYGGKPATASTTDAVLDFFHRGGDGGPSLGIDCSGYVYSAFATAGLKLKKSGRLKAIDVQGISSTMFNNPESNGLTCLSKATFSAAGSLRAGDVIAENGHVVIVASVGADPYGISQLKTEADCKASSIDPRRYDFTILQSSPSRSGIGINHIQASDYFTEDSKMTRGVVDQAVQACKARVRDVTLTVKSSNANVIRHSGTSDCMDTAIALQNESCIASCAPVD